jgi:hypothetical protein
MSIRTAVVLGLWCASLLLASLTRAQVLPLPARATNAPSGSAFAKRIADLSLLEREQELYAQVLAGNVPEFLRKLCPVQLTQVVDGRTNTATLYATPDYLSIGSNEDYFLMPLSPNLGQRLADALDCSLPTPRMVNAIYAAAELKLAPSPIPPTAAMTTLAVFGDHNATVRTQRLAAADSHPLGALVAGHKKDVVLSAKLAAAPGKVAIYGWHRTNGVPIQPLYLGHTSSWVDYSQCTRLVQQNMLVNGERRRVSEVLDDPTLCGLLSDEGPIPNPRYPTNSVAPLKQSATASPRVTNAPASTPLQFPTVQFTTNSSLLERTASFVVEPEIKMHINAPTAEAFTPGKKVLLVFYALPNGNSTAQTIGRTPKSKEEWRYDIQHIGAQTRFLRQLLPDRTIVVVYLEAAQRSWPTWRKQHGDKLIPEVIAHVQKLFLGQEIETILSGHSGGGSFIFGYLNAVETIPNDVVRIAFLDSNYAYERALGHEDKLVYWLKASDNHCLCVLAYNDAVALLDGKHFVSEAGGTWGRSHAMQHDLAKDFAFTSRTNAGFERFSALDGRLQFILKDNPEKQILHTVQVERNGFIHCLLSGTPNEEKGYEYFGERAYSRWIQPE